MQADAETTAEGLKSDLLEKHTRNSGYRLGHPDNFTLKIVGREEYLLGDFPLSQFKVSTIFGTISFLDLRTTFSQRYSEGIRDFPNGNVQIKSKMETKVQYHHFKSAHVKTTGAPVTGANLKCAEQLNFGLLYKLQGLKD